MNNTTNYELLKQIINEEDPIGLIDYDTPESLNEYDSELREIFKKEITLLNSKDLAQWIHKVFKEFFNDDLAKGEEKYKRIANKFIAATRK